MRDKETRQIARQLYAGGRTLEEIGGLVRAHPKSISRWKQQDTAAGRSWDAARTEYEPTSALQALDLLRRREAAYIRASSDDLQDRLFEQRIKMLDDVIRSWEKRLATPERILGPLEIFAFWARDRLPQESRELLSTWIANFGDDLRQGRVEAAL